MLQNFIVENKIGDVSDCSVNEHLEIICQNTSVVRNIIKRFGDSSIEKYLEELIKNSNTEEARTNSISAIIYDYTAPILGKKLASRASNDFVKRPIVMTANHCGVDYFAQSSQGSLLFALSKYKEIGIDTTVPIFSCGSIPLDNLTYPLGFLLYQTNENNLNAIPKKFPILPNSLRRSMVSVSKPFDTKMVERAKKRIESLLEKEKIDENYANCLSHVIMEHYNDPNVIKQDSYSKQSVILNYKIWKELFSESLKIPEMINIELEEVVKELLIKDLKSSNSLIYKMLFEKKLRNFIVEELNKKPACWNIARLSERSNNIRNGAIKNGIINNSGTLFFWGVSSKGRRIPLYIESDARNQEIFKGIDDNGNIYEKTFAAENIINEMNQKKLIPSLFTCFVEIAFARGITCIGGYYQAEYLPIMQKGILKAIQKSDSLKNVGDQIKKVVTNAYLSGMQTVMTRSKDKGLIPAGPLEIIAGNGLKEDDIGKIMNLTIKEAHVASLIETITDLKNLNHLKENWKERLSIDCTKLLGNKIVTK